MGYRTTFIVLLVYPGLWTAKTKSKEISYKYRLTVDSGHSKYCIVIIPEGQATFYHGLRKGAMCAIWPTFYSHPILNWGDFERKSTNKTKSPLGLRSGFGHHILWSFINHKSGYKSRMTCRMARHWSNSNIFRSSNRRWIRFAASLKIFLNAFSWWLWYTLKLLVSCCKVIVTSLALRIWACGRAKVCGKKTQTSPTTH